MNRKRIAQYCCAALVAAGVGLNIQNAIENYGISENSISLVAVPGSGSNTGFWESATSAFVSYWDEKTHNCVEDQCSVFFPPFWTYYGKHEKCKDGNKVAHCWNCASCDA